MATASTSDNAPASSQGPATSAIADPPDLDVCMTRRIAASYLTVDRSIVRLVRMMAILLWVAWSMMPRMTPWCLFGRVVLICDRSSTQSVRDSIYEFIVENGRRFHKYKQGSELHRFENWF